MLVVPPYSVDVVLLPVFSIFVVLCAWYVLRVVRVPLLRWKDGVFVFSRVISTRGRAHQNEHPGRMLCAWKQPVIFMDQEVSKFSRVE